MEALLEVKNLSIGIRKGETLLSAVEDISFEVYPGEILGIVGESGSGKTLTALSIPGLLEGNIEASGRILYHSPDSAPDLTPDAAPGGVPDKVPNRVRNLLSLPEKELHLIQGKEISMIFQEPFSSLNPLVKIGAQIAETLKLHGEKDNGLIKSRIRELMERLRFAEPEKVLDAYPHRLSGGMCQRVMIALAVICRPRLLIADEPTTALDISTQNQILALMKEINKDMGSSVLFISHDLEVIRNLCGRVLVMYSGRILEEGTVDEIFSQPAHEYTKGLLGSLPSRVKKGMDLANIPGKVPSLEEGRPSGCPFHPRCVKAGPACLGDFPEPKVISASHKTRCLLETPGVGVTTQCEN